MSTPAMTFDERYRAAESRDRRFDGQFVMAVRTTGIYCRPSCPARTPKRQNVSFYATSAAAHEAGYRACKRCLPEAAPGSPAWNLRGDTAARAMRLIADGVVEREGVPGLAARLGFSTRQLGRILHAELGASPLALARAQRAQTARMLLVGTQLPITDVAFSAGFASVRQFNDTVREVFGLTPGQLRALRRAEAEAPAGGIRLALPVREPFDRAGVFAWMRAHVAGGMERAGEREYARTLRLAGGPGRFRVWSDAEPGVLRLDAQLARLGDLPSLIARVRRTFDLDADPLAIDQALARHPELRASVAATPGIRSLGTPDGPEMLVRAMVGQQISLAAARTALGRLVDALGERMPDAASIGPSVLFPTPAAIAERGHEVLRGPAARITAIVAAAEAIAGGELVINAGVDGAALREALIARGGIGPWTADYVRLRVTGDPDVLLPGDVAARSGAAALGIPATPGGLGDWAGRAAPWRSYLMAHLWRNAPLHAHHSGNLDARPGTEPAQARKDAAAR